MPPCNCHPPFPRPEPFSPLPRPGKVPDWGKWIRDRLAEKGALLAFPSASAFPDPGAQPNVYGALDTGILYRWDGAHYQVLVDPSAANDVLEYESREAFPETGEHGKLYIAADTGSLYRWGGEGYVALLPGKADKVVPATEGNLAALTQDGNLADSRKKPADFATAAQGAKADTAVQPEDLPERLPNPKALKFLASGSRTTFTSYDGSEAKEIGCATNTKFGLCKLTDALTSTSGADTGLGASAKAVKTVNDKVAAIEGKIPSQASASNQLADKEFVNSSIATETATFRGTFNLVTDLGLPIDATHEQVAEAVKTRLGQADYNGNDYVFVQVPQDLEHPDAMKQVDRYKCVETGTDPVVKNWEYEWTLNNSSFTAAQWAAINSGITSGLVAKLGALPTAEALAQALAGKANRAANPTAGNLAALDEQGNPTDSGVAKSDVESLFFARYYPDGSVKSAAEFTSGIKYTLTSSATERTAMVKPFCNTGDSENDNSNLSGRIVIPPFVDAQGNPYITDDGTRFKVVGVSNGGFADDNTNLTAIIAPSTVTNVGSDTFYRCTSLASVSLPAVTDIGADAFASCTSLSTVDFGDTPRSFVPSLGINVFYDVPSTCTIIVPYTQYDEWIAADNWKDLPQEFVRHQEKADKPATFTTGNLAKFDANGNPTDSGVKASDKLDSTSAAPAFSTSSTYAVGDHVTYNGGLYRCTTAVTTAGAWDASKWTADTMTDPDAVLDITAQNQLRVVAKDGTLLWAQGYDLASTSSATLACDATNNFTFADGATTQAFTLPTAPTGKVGDFGLDIDNSANKSDATISFTNITNNTASVVIPKGENLNDMLAIAAGELARFYITLSTFRVNNLPTWHIMKQIVENGGATV